MKINYRHTLAREAITVLDAAQRAGVSESAVRNWAKRAPISDKIGGNVRINAVAFLLWLSDDAAGLAAFLREDFSHPAVRRAYKTERLPLPTDLKERAA